MTESTVLPQSLKRTMLSLSLTTILCTILLINSLPQANCAPSANRRHSADSNREFEAALDNFLNAYYDEIISKHLETHDHHKTTHLDDAVSSKRAKPMSPDAEGSSTNTNHNDAEGNASLDIYDQMQGDQPASHAAEGENGVILNYNDGNRNMTEQFIKNRDKLRKDNWVEYLKSHILNHIGRSNSTFTKPPEDPPLTDFNITDVIPKIFNTTTLDDDQITEKIRSFYPSCEPPQNQEQDTTKDAEGVMNLYFDFDYNTDNKNSNIASATLRLYRLPQNGTSKFNTKDDCDNLDSVEEDKLLRVSVYWYTKLQKKRRVKRRLSDSKVVNENSRWVELSVKPATKAWNRAATKNLGLAILVEDQEGKPLRAEKYFKGASCTVGVSTPKPIPTIIRDASHVQADELDRIHSLLGRNSTTAVYSDILLLPTVDICYLEFPDNTDIFHYNSARINACNLRKIHEENQRLAERERVERLATLQFPSARHIRHQRQHRQSKLNVGDVGDLKMADDFSNMAASDRHMSELESSLRSSINNKQIVFTREELEEFQRDRGLNR